MKTHWTLELGDISPGGDGSKLWHIYSGGRHFPPRMGAATTYGYKTIFNPKYCPDAKSLAHEFCHVLTTNWVRYAFSYTIGRLWGDKYWRKQEERANGYAIRFEALFLDLAKEIRADLPWTIPTVTITHSL